MNPQQKARERATIILKVRSGQITATQAARQLGISRQRYYRWEKRALRALLKALEAQPKGRPRKRQSDPDTQALQHRMQQLEKQVRLYEQKEKLRTLLKKLEEQSHGCSSQKKTRNDSSDFKRTGKRHLIVCPDGQLSRLPFEMLPLPSDSSATTPVGNKFLVEEKTISYVTSGGEVVRLASPKSKVQSSKSLVMGNPDFDLDLESAPVRSAAVPSRSRSEETVTSESFQRASNIVAVAAGDSRARVPGRC
jgi:transposase